MFDECERTAGSNSRAVARSPTSPPDLFEFMSHTRPVPTAAAAAAAGASAAPARARPVAKRKLSESDSTVHAPPRGVFVPDVVIETDIGHDCDDIEALQVALKDHKLGRIRIGYISTVSCNNAERARVVQHLCACFGISDIPIFPSQRERASFGGKRLDRCTPVWMFERVGNRYVLNKARADVAAVHRPGQKLCPIHPACHSVAGKQAVLRRCRGARVLIIGPGVEVDTFTGLVPPALSDDATAAAGAAAAAAAQSAAVRRLVERVVWQGNYNDRASFNVGCDFAAAAAMQAWAARHGVTHYNIGKLVAYNTQLDRAAFGRLAVTAATAAAAGGAREWAASRCGGGGGGSSHGSRFDLQAHYQLGVMEFRDGNRNLFNCLNFGVSEPGRPAATRATEAFDPTIARHAALKPVLVGDSLRTEWFEALEKLPPMYDVTAYLLLRDAHNNSNCAEGGGSSSGGGGLAKVPATAPLQHACSGTGSDDTDSAAVASDVASDANAGCVWYRLTRESPTRYSVGAAAPDIRLAPAEYMDRIEAELREAMELLQCGVHPGSGATGAAARHAAARTASRTAPTTGTFPDAHSGAASSPTAGTAASVHTCAGAAAAGGGASARCAVAAAL